MRMNQMLLLVLAASSLTGCVVDTALMMAAEAQFNSETPESVGLAPANYRGKSCLELSIDRMSADNNVTYTGEHQDYVRKHGQWAKTSIEQVERETGCLPGTTTKQAGTIDYVLKHPESLKELEADLPPGGVEYIKAGGKLPASASSVISTTPISSPVAEPQPAGSNFGATTPEGLPQTSLAQWIAKEVPESYEGRSCEYLRSAFTAAEGMESSANMDARTWGASKRKAISAVPAFKECPPSGPRTGGMLGAVIGPMDPIKAERLGMPLTGCSIEQVVSGGAAEHAGIQRTDVVVAIGSTLITDHIELMVALSKIPAGSTALLKVWRKGGYVNVPVVLGSPSG